MIKIYTTIRDSEGRAITKIAEIEQFAPTEVGPNFTGMDPAEQNVGSDDTNLSGVDTKNQPQGISESIPSSNSFYTHDTLASKTAGYDRITGIWEPEEWNQSKDDSYLHFYPPLLNEHKYIWYAMGVRPSPCFSTTNIGKGHLFHAGVTDFGDNVYHSWYSIYGISENEQKANQEMQRYRELDKKKFNGHPKEWGFEKEILDSNGNIIGHSWQHIFEINRNFDSLEQAKKNIENIHKTLYDINNTRTSYKYAEIEDTNYEGVGSVFGEGMGPQDISQNVTDVEQGPKGPKSTENSTVQLPAGMQGQEVLPDLTSWYTASNHSYDEMVENDEANDDSDTDDEDDYDDNYTW
jgi:hypothetical protein